MIASRRLSGNHRTVARVAIGFTSRDRMEPAPVGSRKSAVGLSGLPAATHLPSGEIARVLPSPRRTAGLPSVGRTYTPYLSPAPSPLSVKATRRLSAESERPVA